MNYVTETNFQFGLSVAPGYVEVGVHIFEIADPEIVHSEIFLGFRFTETGRKHRKSPTNRRHIADEIRELFGDILLGPCDTLLGSGGTWGSHRI